MNQYDPTIENNEAVTPEVTEETPVAETPQEPKAAARPVTRRYDKKVAAAANTPMQRLWVC